MTEGAPPLPDPELLGVPLSVYAAVLGYSAEGVPLAESLDHAAIPLEDWPTISAAWSAHLAERSHEDPALLVACDQHRFVAEAHVERPLPPLDEDLRAWLDFFRAFSAAEAPFEYLAQHHLIEGDLFRLLALWQARTAADQALREVHARLLGEPPGPPPEVSPRPPALKRETRWPRREKPAPVATVASPPSRSKPALAETSLAIDLSKVVLPFARSSDMSPHGFATGAPAAPSARSRLGETSLAVGVKDTPALPFPQAQKPEDSPSPGVSPAVRFTPAPAPLPLAPSWPEASAPPPAPPVRPQSHLAATSVALTPPVAAPLPFAASAGQSPMAIPSPPSAQPPFPRPDPRFTGTVLAPMEPVRLALPFGVQGPLPSSPSPSAPHRPPPELAGTLPLQGQLTPALPFGAAPPPSAAPEPRLSLVAYAMMHAEITANPSAAVATLGRYGLSPATKPQEDAAWKAKFAAEPALRMAWIRELVEAGNRVRGK